MNEYFLDDIGDCSAPPTREAIEEIRVKQLEALQAVRRVLLDVHYGDCSAAA